MKGKASLVISEPRCERCNSALGHQSCTECQKALNDQDLVYCFGPLGENWHKCDVCGKKVKG